MGLELTTLSLGSEPTAWLSQIRAAKPGSRWEPLETAPAGCSLARNWRARANPFQIAASGRTVYIGGQIDRLGGRIRHNVGAVDAGTCRATSWAPIAPDTSAETSPRYVRGTHGQVLVGGHGGFAAFDSRTGPLSRCDEDDCAIAADELRRSGARIYLGGGFRDGFERRAAELRTISLPSVLPSGDAWPPGVRRCSIRQHRARSRSRATPCWPAEALRILRPRDSADEPLGQPRFRSSGTFLEKERTTRLELATLSLGS